MKLLILGGTQFLGRHIVRQALAAGHEVTLFNRGQTNPDLFQGLVDKVHGDRLTDLGRLAGREFDACIDPSGYLPGQLEAAGAVLADVVDRYVFISSISVYPKYFAGLGEDAEVATVPEGVDDTVYDVRYYGPFKAACEQAIEAAMPGRVLHVRSGLIVGPYDPTHRFTYWPARLQEGGRFIAPVGPDYPVQIIHAADQARWILAMLAGGGAGFFNVTSDNGTYTFADLLNATLAVTGSNAAPVYVPDEFLLEHKVGPWMELPLWLPGEALDMSRASAARAVAAGLELMPLEDVVRSTLDWYNSEPPRDWPAGLARSKEDELLQAWDCKAR